MNTSIADCAVRLFATLLALRGSPETQRIKRAETVLRALADWLVAIGKPDVAATIRKDLLRYAVRPHRLSYEYAGGYRDYDFDARLLCARCCVLYAAALLTVAENGGTWEPLDGFPVGWFLEPPGGDGSVPWQEVARFLADNVDSLGRAERHPALSTVWELLAWAHQRDDVFPVVLSAVDGLRRQDDRKKLTQCASLVREWAHHCDNRIEPDPEEEALCSGWSAPADDDVLGTSSP